MGFESPCTSDVVAVHYTEVYCRLQLQQSDSLKVKLAVSVNCSGEAK
jgi:hypothetical protein